MQYDLLEMGPKVKGNSVTFRIHLPGLDKEARVLVVGSFCDWVMEDSLALRYDPDKNIWKGTIDDVPEGEYEYAYQIKTGSWTSNLSSDPFARLTGENGYSSFVIPPEKRARLDSFSAPPADKLCLYYMNLEDFNENFEGAKNRVRYYLSQLGINGIIFSPWYGCDPLVCGEDVPVHLFAPDIRYGTTYDLKVLVNECHKNGMAVIMDMDFSCVSTEFGFNQMYPLFENKPMLSRMDDSGKKIYLDHKDELTAEFVYKVCIYWLDEFNIDGFRFLNSDKYWDGADGKALAALSRKLYTYRRKSQGKEFYIFTRDTGHYTGDILAKTHVSGAENASFIKHIHKMAENRTLSGEFWKTLDFNQMGYVEDSKIGDDRIKNHVLNLTEDDETNSLIVKMGLAPAVRDRRGYPVGDRKNHWWKVKPYSLAMFTGTGIPVIHNGQEIGENRYLPDTPEDRCTPRPISWHFLADFAGKDLHRFHQKLVMMRNKFPSLRSKNFYHFFTSTDHQVVVFKRYLDDETVIIAINFSNESHDVVIPFPADGRWHEYLDDYDIWVDNREATVKVPARYGRVFFME
ncbi:MAG: alpha amylase C-terminal domain-containing protein [Firmicutes bacterium]|nr:alpha amylase C-terminal domain-containing protein [Bacillota bacterium]